MTTTAWDSSLYVLCALALFVSWLMTIQLCLILPAIRWKDRPVDETVTSWRLSVVIPARNEEVDLANSLRSVLAQQGVDFEVIVINDHSTDRTGEIADSFAAADARVKVLHNPELQAGWLGKVNAMQQGWSIASHELVLFSDADILHAPGAFAAALSVMQREQLDLVSLCPLIRCTSLVENINVPLYMGGFVHLFREALRPDSGRAFAAGAFLLLRSTALRASGGLNSIKTEMLDDVSLATLLKQHGFRVQFWSAPQLVEVRLFKGNWQAWWGPTKNVLAEFHGQLWMTPIILPFPALLFWSPIIAAGWGLFHSNFLLAAAGAFTYANQYLLLLPSRAIYRFHYLKLLAFPLVSIVIICVFSRALYYDLVHGAVFWRGRRIRVKT